METPLLETPNAVPLAPREPDIRPWASGEDAEDLRVIEPRGSLAVIDWGELWRSRDLLYFLTWRDVKVRYKQTVLGAAWVVLQPLLTMLVFSIFFGHLAGLSRKTGGVPYPIYVYAGLLPWMFFANALTSCGASLVGNANLITKVYFPRLIIPFAAAGAGLMDLGVSLVVLLGLMVWYHIPVTGQICLAPVFVLGATLAAMGVGALLAALTVAYRDFRYVVPFLVQIWMFVTPVIYPISIVPERWRWALSLNPMVGLIEGFRAAFLAQPLHWLNIAVSLAVSLVLFVAGAAYFRSVERRFADII